MDRVESKQAKALVAPTMRQLAKNAGFRTRSGCLYAIRDGFLLVCCALYLDSASEQFAKGEARLLVDLSVKTVESDQVLWRICQMTDELDQYSVDPILGGHVVQSVDVAERTFPIGSLDDVARVCQQVVGFAIAGFASFLDSVGTSLDGFYRYVLGLDPSCLWYSEIIFPIAYIQLGDYRAALEYLNLVGHNAGALNHLAKRRSMGYHLAEYCKAHLGESRPVSLSHG